MMNQLICLHLSNWLLHSLVFVAFFHRLQPAQEISGRRRYLSYLSFLLLIPLYLSVDKAPDYNFINTCIRFFYRAMCYALFLKLRKRTGWAIFLYAALLFTCIYTACQALFQVPMLFADTSEFFVSLMRNVMFIPVFGVCYFVLPEDHFERVTAERVSILFLVIVCLLYTKNSLFVLNYTGKRSTEYLSIILIMLHFFLLAFLIAFERYTYTTVELEQSRLQDIMNGFRIRNLKNNEANEKNLRALQHDMKNHFLVIQEMARQGKIQELQAYTAQLVAQSSRYERKVQTGNTLLDGLLSEKILEAEQEHIHTTVALNFRPITYVKDVDLCTIFGNAVDNALEACRKIEVPEGRFIAITGKQAAGFLFVTIENSHREKLRFHNGLPVTTKSQAHFHGFGLRNIHQTVTRYQGTMNIDTNSEGRFSLTLMFPMEEA